MLNYSNDSNKEKMNKRLPKVSQMNSNPQLPTTPHLRPIPQFNQQTNTQYRPSFDTNPNIPILHSLSRYPGNAHLRPTPSHPVLTSAPPEEVPTFDKSKTQTMLYMKEDRNVRKTLSENSFDNTFEAIDRSLIKLELYDSIESFDVIGRIDTQLNSKLNKCQICLKQTAIDHWVCECREETSDICVDCLFKLIRNSEAAGESTTDCSVCHSPYFGLDFIRTERTADLVDSVQHNHTLSLFVVLFPGLSFTLAIVLSKCLLQSWFHPVLCILGAMMVFQYILIIGAFLRSRQKKISKHQSNGSTKSKTLFKISYIRVNKNAIPKHTNRKTSISGSSGKSHSESEASFGDFVGMEQIVD